MTNIYILDLEQKQIFPSGNHPITPIFDRLQGRFSLTLQSSSRRLQGQGITILISVLLQGSSSKKKKNPIVIPKDLSCFVLFCFFPTKMTAKDVSTTSVIWWEKSLRGWFTPTRQSKGCIMQKGVRRNTIRISILAMAIIINFINHSRTVCLQKF